MTDLFRKLHHICVVVHDIDKAQAWYESIGILPWASYPPLSEYEELEVPSKNGFLSLKYRVCNMPTIQIQLCEPGPEPSPQRTHLETKGESVFHMGFEVPDADLAAISPKLTPEVRQVLSVDGSIRARSGAGGTALPRVLEQIATLRKFVMRREGA
jgi:catechol 2,3-dioxygenase-like lactoylglutathione lyase family enzyme